MEDIRRDAREHRWLEYHPYDSKRSTAGWPDLFMVREPEHEHGGGAHVCELVIEFKGLGTPVTLEQDRWLRAIRATRHPWRRVMVVREGDGAAIAEAKAVLAGP